MTNYDYSPNIRKHDCGETYEYPTFSVGEEYVISPGVWFAGEDSFASSGELEESRYFDSSKRERELLDYLKTLTPDERYELITSEFCNLCFEEECGGLCVDRPGGDW